MIFPSWRKSPIQMMGILNLTPDSFSDGGRWSDADSAVKHALEMIDQGADIIDIGAESTRPGFTPVPEEEEWARLEPVLSAVIPSVDVPISVDTMKPKVAERCISKGVGYINDVNGLRADGMMEACSQGDVKVVISHMHGSPLETHSSKMGADYREVIRRFLDGQCSRAIEAGISEKNLIVDPGVGFGKTMEQNMEIVKDLSFLGGDHPILVGVSRKRFLKTFYPGEDIDEVTAKVSSIAAHSGASILRVHDVAKTVGYIMNE